MRLESEKNSRFLGHCPKPWLKALHCILQYFSAWHISKVQGWYSRDSWGPWAVFSFWESLSLLTTGTIDSRSELCVSGKTGGGSSNSNFLLLRTWDGEFFFFFLPGALVWRKKGETVQSHVTWGGCFQRVSYVARCLYWHVENHLGEFGRSGSNFPKVYIIRFRSQLLLTLGMEVVGVLWMAGVEQV